MTELLVFVRGMSLDFIDTRGAFCSPCVGMNKSLLRFLAVLMGICVSGPWLRALSGNETCSPNFLAAVESLRAAKEADDPGPNLQDALKYLAKATNNAGGYRDKAVDLVNTAVDLAKQGDKTDMVLKVDHAIALLHEGMDRGGWRQR